MTPPGFSTFYVFIAIVILVLLRVVRRTIANYKGTRFNLSKTVVFGCVYVAMGILFSGLSLLDGVSHLLLIPEISFAAFAAYWSYRYSDSCISFWKTIDGALYFRGGILVYIIYSVGIVARLSIDTLLIGPAMFGFSSGEKLAGTALDGSMATDILLMFGVGLLVGRSIRVARRYRRIQRGEEIVSSGLNRQEWASTRLAIPSLGRGRQAFQWKKYSF